MAEAREFAAGDRFGRRAALGGAAALLAGGFAACGQDSPATSSADDRAPIAAQPADVQALFELLGMERDAIRAYERAQRFSRGPQLRLLQELGQQATQHVRTLQALIDEADGPATERTPIGGTPFVRDSASARRAARATAAELTRAYLERIPILEPGEARRTVMTMLGNQAEQLAVLGGPSVLANSFNV